MNLILRVIMASILSLPLAAIFVILGIGILFLTPFTSTPLFGRLPGVSEKFCPENARLVVERYSRSIHSQAKNNSRVICFDSAGSRVAEVTNQTNLAALGTFAVAGYLIAWVALFRLARGVLQGRALRERWYMLVMFSSCVTLLVWSVTYLYRQPTNREMERAAMVVLGVTVVFLVVFFTAHHYFHKKSGGRS